MPRVAAAVVLAAGLCATGCIVEPSFQPDVGGELALAGSWTLDGAPATEASCAAAGAGTVRVVFVDVDVEYESATLTWACAAGAFDTGGERVLRRGDWAYFWRASGADGAEVARTATRPLITSSLDAGDKVTLPVADLRTAR